MVKRLFSFLSHLTTKGVSSDQNSGAAFCEHLHNSSRQLLVVDMESN